MKTIQKMYQIGGHTKAGTYCTTSLSRDLKKVISQFIENYPRFKGKARILHAKHMDCGHGLWMKNSTPWETMDTFESTKELKTYGV